MNSKTSENSHPDEIPAHSAVKSRQSDNIAAHVAQDAVAPEHDLPATRPPESGGQAGLEPTRYGDWEKKGRCTDF
ncbi:MAG: DUF1674 domain-containing protein [Granulosicoccus sp.]